MSESSIKAEHLQMKEKETKTAQKLLDVQTKAYENNGRKNSLDRPAQMGKIDRTNNHLNGTQIQAKTDHVKGVDNVDMGAVLISNKLLHHLNLPPGQLLGLFLRQQLNACKHPSN